MDLKDSSRLEKIKELRASREKIHEQLDALYVEKSDIEKELYKLWEEHCKVNGLLFNGSPSYSLQEPTV